MSTSKQQTTHAEASVKNLGEMDEQDAILYGVANEDGTICDDDGRIAAGMCAFIADQLDSLVAINAARLSSASLARPA